MIKKYYIILFFSIISLYTFSQENVKTNTSNFGQNKKHFAYSFINFGFIIPPSEGNGADIIYGQSHIFTYGIKYKYKINNIFSIGTGINYNSQIWNLQQNSSKTIPNNIIYDKEKIQLNNIGTETFLRFNIGKRNNSIGNYIDISPYAELSYKTKHETVINSINSNNILGEEYNVTTNVHLNYIENFNYGIKLIFGLGRVSFFGKYRISNIFTPEFKTSISNTELNRLIIGLEIGLHE